MKTFPVLVLLILLVLTGCSREAGPTPEATQTAAPPPLSVTYCDIDLSSDLCLDGFGQEGKDKLLILLKKNDQLFDDIDVQVKYDWEEYPFECDHSQVILGNIYCTGEVRPENGDSIQMNVYSRNDDSLIAKGVFIVEYTNIPVPAALEPAAPPEKIPTPRPTRPNYPNPSYPNPSYPNPTSTP